MKITTLLLGLTLAVGSLQAQATKETRQTFQEYGFSIDSPLPLTHEPTKQGTDSNGNPTKADSFSSDVVNDKTFLVYVVTYTAAVDTGVTDDYLDLILKKMTADNEKMGEPYHFKKHGVPAVSVIFTVTHEDGTVSYVETVLMLRGNRMYVLREAYKKHPDQTDWDGLLFFESFKLL
jgi:hypothetical protein